ncbi:MAG TPA: hypothetical protein VD993_00720 [Chitinophagaceae bacterium]|nr:hypothetical protein [Chitinophagaceae bacterium]
MKADNPIILVADNSCPTGEKLELMLEEVQKLQAILMEYACGGVTQVLSMQAPANLIKYNIPPEQEFSQEYRDRDTEDLNVVMMTSYTLEPDNKLCTYLGAQYFIAVSDEVEIIQFRISEVHLN